MCLGPPSLPSTYFAFLILCHRSSSLRRMYPPHGGGHMQRQQQGGSGFEQEITSFPSSRTTVKSNVPSLSLAVGLSFGISYLAKGLEHSVGLPGISAAIITAASLLVYSQWRDRYQRSFKGVLGLVATTSSLFFNMFFAAIGAGARLSQIVMTGPAMTAFMGITLLVHALTVGGGVFLVNRWSPTARVGIDDMVCASNANIGGPATAAAMATNLDCHHLVVPSTIFGTVGYAAATLLGMTMYRLAGR